MSGHTPGPWRLSDDTDIGFYPAVQRGRSGGFEVRDSDKDRALADARLIAAAPDLLAGYEAIKHSIQQARMPGNDWRRELALIENTVDAAIKAATGGAE